MTEIILTPEEKTIALRWLSQSSRAGGWVFLFMAAFPFVLLLLVWGRILPAAENWDGESTAVFFTWGIICLWPAIWLLRYKQKLARLLDGPLQPQTAVITRLQPIPYAGWRVSLQFPATDPPQIGHIRYIVRPDLQVNDKLALLILADGRFFPRNPTQGIDLGALDTPERRLRQRHQIGWALFIFLSLAAMGILLGLYGQGRLG